MTRDGPIHDKALASPRLDRLAPRGLLARLRIRNKLIVVHTIITLALAAVLMLALRPAVGDVVERAEQAAALALLDRIAGEEGENGAGVLLASGTAEDLGFSQAEVAGVFEGTPSPLPPQGGHARAIVRLHSEQMEDPPQFLLARARLSEARLAVTRLHVLTILALIGVYLLVALVLEGLIMPRHVYGPIRHMLHADRAVQAGGSDDELIPEHVMPADELGEIMRSRNQSIRTIREQEQRLSDALEQLETVATDLARKNHLLENARRNLVDADRLASLGMLSAGIAHELNTPLAVLKGLVERLRADPGSLDQPQRDLMFRVVGRLERLGESLLDFARARPARTQPTEVRALVEEAATLVRLDRDASQTEIVNDIPQDLIIQCDGDRLVQVFVNLLRNGIDAARDGSARRPLVRTAATIIERDGRAWASITVADNGRGIPTQLLTSIFEPFVSTRLDAKGTGLGLAVAHGIVAEHGGRLLARNAHDGGAVFEVLVPLEPTEAQSETSDTDPAPRSDRMAP